MVREEALEEFEPPDFFHWLFSLESVHFYRTDNAGHLAYDLFFFIANCSTMRCRAACVS